MTEQQLCDWAISSTWAAYKAPRIVAVRHALPKSAPAAGCGASHRKRRAAEAGKPQSGGRAGAAVVPACQRKDGPGHARWLAGSATAAPWPKPRRRVRIIDPAVAGWSTATPSATPVRRSLRCTKVERIDPASASAGRALHSDRRAARSSSQAPSHSCNTRALHEQADVQFVRSCRCHLHASAPVSVGRGMRIAPWPARRNGCASPCLASSAACAWRTSARQFKVAEQLGRGAAAPGTRRSAVELPCCSRHSSVRSNTRRPGPPVRLASTARPRSSTPSSSARPPCTEPSSVVAQRDRLQAHLRGVLCASTITVRSTVRGRLCPRAPAAAPRRRRPARAPTSACAMAVDHQGFLAVDPSQPPSTCVARGQPLGPVRGLRPAPAPAPHLGRLRRCAAAIVRLLRRCAAARRSSAAPSTCRAQERRGCQRVADLLGHQAGSAGAPGPAPCASGTRVAA